MHNDCNSYLVKYAGICGSDINKAEDPTFLEKDILTLGHEVVCQSDTGDLYVVNPFFCASNCPDCSQRSYLHCAKVNRLGSGNADGGYSGKICISFKNLYSVPLCSHPEVGVLCDGVAVVLHGFHMLTWLNVQKMAIIGAGSIGVLAALIAKEAHPALTIDIFCKSDKKRDYLFQLYGNSFNYIDINDVSRTNDCYDLVLEAVGGKQTNTLSLAIDIVRNNGSILVLGSFHEDCNYPSRLRQLFYKQITLTGVNSFCKEYHDFQKAFQWTFSHEELLFPLITDFYHIDRSNVNSKELLHLVLEHKMLKGCLVYE